MQNRFYSCSFPKLILLTTAECKKLKFTEDEAKTIRQNPEVLKEFLAAHGITFGPEDALIISKGVLSFSLRTIHFSPVSTDEQPECYKIKVIIAFDEFCISCGRSAMLFVFVFGFVLWNDLLVVC